MRLQQGHDVGCPRHAIHRHDGKQHQKRACERIKKEFETRIDPPPAAPYADDEKHRDEAALEEKIKEHEIKGAENPGHQGFKNEEGNQIFLDASQNRFPGRENAIGIKKVVEGET